MRVFRLASMFWSFSRVLYRGMRTRFCKSRTLHIAVRYRQCGRVLKNKYMDKRKFEELINRSEGTKIDFKRQQYDLKNDKSGEKTANFIKDIISFANTIRNESAYIIIGIEEQEDGKKNFHGIDKHIDDAIFQQKIKDKVSPKPIFTYSLIDYKENTYGVFEIPINSYSKPIESIKPLKGLKKDTIYFRRGSSNSEATPEEIIKINNWFRNIEQIETAIDTKNSLSTILKKLNDNKYPLAPIASELLEVSRNKDDKTLINFFESELQGWNKEKMKMFPKGFFQYRIIKALVCLSPYEIDTIQSDFSNTGIQIYRELLEREDYVEKSIFFNLPISALDNEIDRIREIGTDKLYSDKRDASKLLGNNNLSGHIMLYYLYDNYLNLVQNIRFKYMAELMKIMKCRVGKGESHP